MALARPWWMFSLLFMGMALSGCLGGDDAGPGATGAGMDTESPEPTTGAPVPTTQTTKIVTVDNEAALFAPDWNVGETWTYKVSGRSVPAEYEVTVGVADRTDAAYVMATDSEDELKNRAAGVGGLFLGMIDRRSLNIDHDGGQDLIGFDRPVGAQWDISILGTAFPVVKEPVVDVDHTGGPSKGIRLRGTNSAWDNLTIEYASGARGVTLLLFTDGKGDAVLRYELTAHNPSGSIGGFRSWEVIQQDNGDATGPGNFVGYEEWPSDGAGDLLFVRAISHCRGIGSVADQSLPENPGVGLVRILDPANEVAMEFDAVGEGRVVEDLLLDDSSGTWRTFTACYYVGRTEATIYQVSETVY